MFIYILFHFLNNASTFQNINENNCEDQVNGKVSELNGQPCNHISHKRVAAACVGIHSVCVKKHAANHECDSAGDCHLEKLWNFQVAKSYACKKAPKCAAKQDKHVWWISKSHAAEKISQPTNDKSAVWSKQYSRKKAGKNNKGNAKHAPEWDINIIQHKCECSEDSGV